jgi:DNA-binding CsgD family transcriptional regulator
MAEQTPRRRPLTKREIEVIALLAKGMTFGEIGAELWITVHTVKTHVRRASRAVGARNKVHLLAIAVGTGQLVLDGAP